MKTRVDELEGPALDWAVAIIEKPKNLICFCSIDGGPRTRGNLPYYSTDWSQGGPLISRYAVSLMTKDGYRYIADIKIDSVQAGTSPLIAACRAIVAAKLGNTIDIPDELVEATHA